MFVEGCRTGPQKLDPRDFGISTHVLKHFTTVSTIILYIRLYIFQLPVTFQFLVTNVWLVERSMNLCPNSLLEIC